MFQDDRSQLQQIGEWMSRIEDGLRSSESPADEVVWWRLGMVEQSCSRLTRSYMARHPEIYELGLPTLNEVLNEPAPPTEFSKSVAMRAIAAFAPLLANLPPEPGPPARDTNPATRLKEVVEGLLESAASIRAEGIVALYLFGSIARRADEPGSDVDLAYVVSADRLNVFSLIDRSRLSRQLSEILGSDVDLVELSMLHEDIRKRVDADRLTIFEDIKQD